MKNKGFTIIEILLAVAIMAVVTLLGVGDIVKEKYALHQEEANKYAELKFLDVTNELTGKRISGCLEDFNVNTSAIGYTPENYSGEGLGYYISDNNYLVEYDLWSGLVFGVFYANDGNFDFYTNTVSDEVYRHNTNDDFITYTKDSSTNQVIAYYSSGGLDVYKYTKADEEDEPENINNNLYLAAGFVYYEVYSDGSYGVYYVHSFDGSVSDGTTSNLSYADKTIVGDGYGIAIGKEDTHYLYANQKCDSKTTKEYSLDTKDAATIESSTGYLFALPTSYVDEKEESFYTRLGFWYLDTKNIAPTGLVNPEVIYANLRTAKNGIYVGKGNTNPTASNGGNIPTNISIRTARQLYDMSLYYNNYIASAETVTFNQEYNIDYSTYDWAKYTTTTISNPKQTPIGVGPSNVDKAYKNSFMSNYNGNNFSISNVTFIAEGDYCGLFGYILDYPYRDSKGKPIDSGRITNLTLKNCSFEAATNRGCITGKAGDGSVISNCKVEYCNITNLYGTKTSKATIN